MTNLEQMAAKFPDHIDRIKELCTPDFLHKSPESRLAKNTMASGFDWNATREGWDFWNNLYENTPR